MRSSVSATSPARSAHTTAPCTSPGSTVDCIIPARWTSSTGSRAASGSGDSERANTRHEYAYNLLLRSFGSGDPALLPGLFALADWYLTNYNIFSARALYRHAVYVSTKVDDDDDAAMIRALRGVAASYLSERFPPYHEPRTQASGSSGPYTSRTRSVGSINSFGNGERALIEVVRVVNAREDGTNEDRPLPSWNSATGF